MSFKKFLQKTKPEVPVSAFYREFCKFFNEILIKVRYERGLLISRNPASLKLYEKHAVVIKLCSHDVLPLKIEPNGEYLNDTEFLITPFSNLSLSRQQCSS